MARIDYEQRIKWAQEEVMNVARQLTSMRMRLEGTRFESMANKCCDDLVNLNEMLVKHIRKG